MIAALIRFYRYLRDELQKFFDGAGFEVDDAAYARFIDELEKKGECD